MGQIKEHNAIRLIRMSVQDLPDVEFEYGSHSISVRPNHDNGFEVRMEVIDEEHYLVYYDQWQRRFKNEGEAVFFFIKGLTPMSRLRVESIPSDMVKRTAEHNTDFTWHSEGSKTSIRERNKLIRDHEVKYLQNNVIQEPVI